MTPRSRPTPTPTALAASACPSPRLALLTAMGLLLVLFGVLIALKEGDIGSFTNVMWMLWVVIH